MHTYSGVATATFPFFSFIVNCDLLNSAEENFKGILLWSRGCSLNHKTEHI